MGDAVSCSPMVDEDITAVSSCSSDAEEHVPILHMATRRLNFHDHRSKALWYADRARTQLAEYANLAVKILQAKDLEGGTTASWACNIKSADPYVQVYLDDVLVNSTKPYGNSNIVDPEWNWECTFPIQNASSIVRLQVMNYNLGRTDDFLGFVEFPVADIPFDRTFSGWLSLSAASELCNTAIERLWAAQKVSLQSRIELAWRTIHRYLRDPLGADTIVEVKSASGGQGSVLVELQLICADKGIANDEWFAHCLPKPCWHVFPDGGALASRGDLDMQKLYDRVIVLINLLLNGLVRPFLDCIAYVLEWREKWLSIFVLVPWLLLTWYPQYFLAGLFGSASVILFSLRSASRRRKMAANPHSAELNNNGFKAVASMRSTLHMATYLERVILVMDGRILDKGKLFDFAAFSFELAKPVVSYTELKQQLRDAAKSISPFLAFNDAPLKSGSLCSRGGDVGEVIECLDPKLPAGTRRYRVRFFDDSRGVDQLVEEDDLGTYMNFRWMSNPAVQSVIPDSVVETLAGWQVHVEYACLRADRAVRIAHEFVSWKRLELTGTVNVVLLALALKNIAEIQAMQTYFINVSTQTGLNGTLFMNKTGKAFGHTYDAIDVSEKLAVYVAISALSVLVDFIKALTLVIVLIILVWNADFTVFLHQSISAYYACWKARRKQPGLWKCCEREIVLSSTELASPLVRTLYCDSNSSE